ncbi:Fructokinase [Bacillus subtilis subsp. subtilis]|nr:Fructokinase [Bacillus subtilis subsp. subtilis]
MIFGTWELEGYYIAQALAQYILILAPKKIILGGGVMQQKQVFSYIYLVISFLGYLLYAEALSEERYLTGLVPLRAFCW